MPAFRAAFVMLAMLGFMGQLRFLAADDPTQSCYITISNGTESCYYSPPTGYQCDYGPVQDPTHHNLPPCSSVGLCYTILAGNDVCYYTAPYGYSCYFKLEPSVIANMTNCDNLRASEPPVISVSASAPVPRLVDENAVLSLGDVSVTDPSAQQSEADGRGYLLVTFQATNGQVGFDPTQSWLTPAQQTAAVYALSHGESDSNGGVKFIVGNASAWFKTLQLEARVGSLAKILPALVFKGALYYNYLLTGGCSLTINVNDQGLDGGTPQQDTVTLTFSVRPINQPPFIIFPTQNATFEEITMAIQGFQILDVDADEALLPGGSVFGDNRITLTISVTKGRFLTPMPAGTVMEPGGRTVHYYNTQAVINAALVSLQYVPDTYTNDRTYPGVENMTILANDLGHTGYVVAGLGTNTTLVVPLHVIPVNNAPVIFLPDMLGTDEDVAFQGLNVNVTDVDTCCNITVTLSVLYGNLSCPTGCPTVLGPSTTVTFVADLYLISEITSSIIYRPNHWFRGYDNLTVTADDGQSFNHSRVRWVSILVDAVNNPPTFTATCPSACLGSVYTQPGSQPAITVGSTLVLNGASNTSPAFSIFDPDAGQLWVQCLLSAAKGTIQIVNTTGIAELSIPKNTSVATLASCTGSSCPTLIVFMAPQTVVSTALQGLTYYRTSSGTDMLLIAVNDLQHTGKGKAWTALEYVNIY